MKRVKRLPALLSSIQFSKRSIIGSKLSTDSQIAEHWKARQWESLIPHQRRTAGHLLPGKRRVSLLKQIVEQKRMQRLQQQLKLFPSDRWNYKGRSETDTSRLENLRLNDIPKSTIKIQENTSQLHSSPTLHELLTKEDTVPLPVQNRKDPFQPNDSQQTLLDKVSLLEKSLQTSEKSQLKFQQSLLTQIKKMDQKLENLTTLGRLEKKIQQSVGIHISSETKVRVRLGKEEVRIQDQIQSPNQYSIDEEIPQITRKLKQSGLQPHFTSPFDIYVIDSIKETEQFFKVLYTSLTGKKHFLRVVGVDTETAGRQKDRHTPSLVQIAFGKDLVVLFLIRNMCSIKQKGERIVDNSLFPVPLKEFLALEHILKVGVGIRQDAHYLLEKFDVSVKNILCLKLIADVLNIQEKSLASLSRSYVGMQLIKSESKYYWDASKHRLTHRAAEYAAKDALSSLLVFRAMLSRPGQIEFSDKMITKRDNGKSFSLKEIETQEEQDFGNPMLTRPTDRVDQKLISTEPALSSLVKSLVRKLDTHRYIDSSATWFVNRPVYTPQDSPFVTLSPQNEALVYHIEPRVLEKKSFRCMVTCNGIITPGKYNLLAKRLSYHKKCYKSFVSTDILKNLIICTVGAFPKGLELKEIENRVQAVVDMLLEDGLIRFCGGI